MKSLLKTIAGLFFLSAVALLLSEASLSTIFFQKEEGKVKVEGGEILFKHNAACTHLYNSWGYPISLDNFHGIETCGCNEKFAISHLGGGRNLVHLDPSGRSLHSSRPFHYLWCQNEDGKEVFYSKLQTTKPVKFTYDYDKGFIYEQPESQGSGSFTFSGSGEDLKNMLKNKEKESLEGFHLEPEDAH